jgi:hypothetical protein
LPSSVGSESKYVTLASFPLNFPPFPYTPHETVISERSKMIGHK